VKTYFVVVTLIGLFFDIVGAFFLSAEAIGLERIRLWRKLLFDDPSYVTSTTKTVEMERRASQVNLRRLPLILVFISISVGGYVGGWLSQTIDAGHLTWLPKYSGLAIGILAGAVIGFYSIPFITLILKAGSGFSG
jgi:hypothetical protein